MTILNVEPGGTCAVNARFSAPPSGPLATASTAPSLTRTATTIAERLAAPASAASAAFCVRDVRAWSSPVSPAWARRGTAPCRTPVTSPSGALRGDHDALPGRAAQLLVVPLPAARRARPGRPRRTRPGSCRCPPWWPRRPCRAARGRTRGSAPGRARLAEHGAGQRRRSAARICQVASSRSVTTSTERRRAGLADALPAGRRGRSIGGSIVVERGLELRSISCCRSVTSSRLDARR